MGARLQQLFPTAVRFLLGALLLWLVLRGIDWPSVWEVSHGVSLPWLLLAPLVAVAGHVTRAYRWSHIVQASSPVPFRAVFSSWQIGALLNIALPLRLGEAGRVLVLSRLARQPVASSLALVGLDRLADLTGFLAVLFLASVTFPTHGGLELPAGTLGNTAPLVVSSDVLGPVAVTFSLLLGVALAGTLALYLGHRTFRRLLSPALGGFPAPLAAKARATADEFTRGLAVLGSTPALARALFLSLLAWSLNALSLAVVIRAFRLDCPWFTPVVTLAMIAVLVAAPLAPGLIGQFHLAVIVGLLATAPAITIPESQAVAVIAHLVSVGTTAGLGVYCLHREHLSFASVARQSGTAGSSRREEP